MQAVQNTQDYLQGNLSKHLVQLTIPLVLGNILQELYNTIDAFIIGRYAGQEEFAAVGIAGTIMNLFLFALVGCCTGVSVLFAHAYGTRNMKELRLQHFSTLLVGLGCTLLLAILGLVSIPWLLVVLQTPVPLQGYVSLYMHWILFSLPATFLYNFYASLLRASGDTRAALFVLAAAVGTNFILDILFVAVLSKGIEGAAMATAITQIFSAVICIIYLNLTHPELILHQNDCYLQSDRLRKILSFGFVGGLHQCSLYLGKMLVQGTVNSAGTEIIAAYTAGTRIEGFANSFGTSGSTSTSILTAQNYGAGQKKRVNDTFRCSFQWMAALGILSGLVMFIFAPSAVSLMLGAEKGTSFTAAVQYLRLVSVFYPFCFTGNTFTGYYDGIGKVTIPFWGAALHITIRVILSWLLFHYVGLNMVALATGLGWICANFFWGFLRSRYLFR